MTNKKVRQHTRIGVPVVILLFIVALTIYSNYQKTVVITSSVAKEPKIDNTELWNTLTWVHDPEEFESNQIEQEIVQREVIYSNYYLGDGSSGDITASGLTIKDFKVNEQGFYTYNDLVVVATGSNRLSGLKDGFITHELYEELTLEINGIVYKSIVLDVCGTCTWGKANETLQRIDVFTTHDVLGLTRGIVYE